jgi:hypothetical protein
MKPRTTMALGMLLLAAATAVHAADFSGIWERYPDPFEGGVDYPPPPGGPPPLKAPYAEAYKSFIEKRDQTVKSGAAPLDPSTRCLPEGMPTLMGGIYAIEILQAQHQVVVLAEFLSQTRRISLKRAMPPVDEIFPSYNGYSVGRWEGNVLVVQTAGVREDVQFMNMPHSDRMRITERFRLPSPDRLEIDVTIEDPVTLEKPYSFTFGYRRLRDYQILENICDNNRWHVDEKGNAKLEVNP